MLIEQLSSLGAMAWPLIISSCLGFAMVLERLVTYAMLPSLKKKNLRALFSEIRACTCNANSKTKLCSNLCKGKGIRQGIAVLLSHNSCSKEMREEVAGLWLLKQKRSLHAWLKPLMLIGILSPMFGLLGTVLGLINMFQGIAVTAGSGDTGCSRCWSMGSHVYHSLWPDCCHSGFGGCPRSGCMG